MSVSLEYLERSAEESGFQVAALEKVVRLGELARGVAILNLCFGPPRRLSVDLDFNYIGQGEREKML